VVHFKIGCKYHWFLLGFGRLGYQMSILESLTRMMP